MASIRVLIADSQALLRESLSILLAAHEALTVVGCAEDLAAAARLAAELHPDVIVTDLILPDGRGAEVIGCLTAAWPQARLIALTTASDEETVAAAVAVGAQGYILKNRPAADLIQAIQTVMAGGVTLDPAVLPIIWRRFQQLLRCEDVSSEPLSSFERDVLRWLAVGKSTRQVAEALASSPAAVERAVAQICQKLHARNRAQAAAIALRRGLISLP